MSYKVLVTPRTFGKSDPVPLAMLEEAGCEIVANNLGRMMTEAELAELIVDVDGVIAGLDPFTEDVLSKAGKLKAICRYGVGVNNIALDYAKNKGIAVANTPGANSLAVAELTIGLLFAVCRRISRFDQDIRQGVWRQYPGMQLGGKTMGVVGTGQIGRHVAQLARGLGMGVVCYDVYPDLTWAEELGMDYVSLPELIKAADFISLHIPYNEGTHHLIGRAELDQMKPSAVVLNTSRGGIIDEVALWDAVSENRIWGAGLDVFEKEPPLDSPLAKLDHVVLTSHIGSHTQESVENMGRMAVRNLLACLNGDRSTCVLQAIQD